MVFEEERRSERDGLEPEAWEKRSAKARGTFGLAVVEVEDEVDGGGEEKDKSTSINPTMFSMNPGRSRTASPSEGSVWRRADRKERASSRREGDWVEIRESSRRGAHCVDMGGDGGYW
jgi:hypothetical protein